MLRLFLSCVVFVALGYRPAQADGATVVALAPITQIGGTGTKGLNALETRIEKGIAALPGISLLRADTVQRTTRKAKRPELRTCDGDAGCLAALGKLVGADFVVYAEVSDLGSSQVIYLKVIETTSGKELRSTTLELGSELGKSTNKKRASKAAAAQLLAPNLHVGTLKIESSVPGATVFLDGHAITTTPDKPIRIYVGSHALRVTHPEHSDYVRFVDVRFEEETLVKAELMDLPGLSQKLSATGILHDADNTTVQYRERPWYYQWYTITGGVAILAITSAVLASGDSSISPDLVRDL